MSNKKASVTEKISEKDKNLLDEIKRIKKLQKGLYKEYEVTEWGEETEGD